MLLFRCFTSLSIRVDGFVNFIFIFVDVMLLLVLDLAVGAPFEEDSGVVYVYFGSRRGLSVEHQVIKGSTLSPTLKGFGMSISRGVDMDQNKYPGEWNQFLQMFIC